MRNNSSTNKRGRMGVAKFLFWACEISSFVFSDPENIGMHTPLDFVRGNAVQPHIRGRMGVVMGKRLVNFF